MSFTLLIVESPSKARTIQKYLNSGYKVVASFGHVMDLPEKEFGVEGKLYVFIFPVYFLRINLPLQELSYMKLQKMLYLQP